LAAGCISNAARIDVLARSAGMRVHQASAGTFPSLVYVKFSDSGGPLWVFIEGDGEPWREWRGWRGGSEPSVDPTTRDPLALQLAIRTPATAAYITRPCYQKQLAPNCTPEQWTFARYSPEIVDSMAAVVREAQGSAGADSVVLAGYSGGGVLAVLIAERLDKVTAVVTIGANLDTDAWVAHHGYLPLSGSLNPARSEREHRWPELHLQGANDAIVPPATTDEYFRRYPTAQRRIVERYDHVCCWINEWQRYFDLAASAVSGKSENTPSIPRS
jgi:pimeloyl-ACP methyl ester carboxylesterase